MTGAIRLIENTGRASVAAIEEIGYHSSLFAESFYWLIVGPFIGQPVRLSNVVAEMMKIGVLALPVVALLSFSNGVMMAIQGIATPVGVRCRIPGGAGYRLFGES